MRHIKDTGRYVMTDPQDQPDTPYVLFVEVAGKWAGFKVDTVMVVEDGSRQGIRFLEDPEDPLEVVPHVVVEMHPAAPYQLVDAWYLYIETTEERLEEGLESIGLYTTYQLRGQLVRDKAIQAETQRAVEQERYPNPPWPPMDTRTNEEKFGNMEDTDLRRLLGYDDE